MIRSCAKTPQRKRVVCDASFVSFAFGRQRATVKEMNPAEKSPSGTDFAFHRS